MNRESLTRDYAAHVAALSAAYDRLLTEHRVDALVVHSGTARKRTEFDDQYWPLRPSPHFQHWVPLSEADAAVVLRPGHRPMLARVSTVDFWETAPKPLGDHFHGHFHEVTLTRAEGLADHLPRAGRVVYVGEDRARAASWGISQPGDHNPAALVAAMDALRTTKTAYERECLREANRIAARGHDVVREAYAAGAEVEFDLHLLYLGATRQDDAETPYKNIVALDRNAATLHHITYRKHPQGSGSGAPGALLLDAGASAWGYCSDITRTWVRGRGAVADAFAAMVAGVERMQQRLCDEVAVGKGYEWLHDESHRQVGGILRDVGIVRGTAEEAVAAGITRKFYPHGLGHSLGLQCHDVGCALTRPREDNPFLRNTSVIAPEQVFTIEPGIYFIPSLLDALRHGPHAASVDFTLVDALSALGGVRIEDDLRVLPTGVENFTRAVLPVGGGRL